MKVVPCPRCAGDRVVHCPRCGGYCVIELVGPKGGPMVKGCPECDDGTVECLVCFASGEVLPEQAATWTLRALE